MSFPKGFKVECHHCKEHFFISFENIMGNNSAFNCPNCRQKFPEEIYKKIKEVSIKMTDSKEILKSLPNTDWLVSF